MKKLLAALLVTTALVAPSAAFARPVTITATMNGYSGNAAYLAVWLTKPDGSYQSTLWLAGNKVRYFGDLRGWVKAARTAASLNVDGITGASVGSGQTLTIHADIADAMLDAGYQLHVESAVEHGGDYPDDAVVTVSAKPQEVPGTGYVKALKVSF